MVDMIAFTGETCMTYFFVKVCLILGAGQHEMIVVGLMKVSFLVHGDEMSKAVTCL